MAKNGTSRWQAYLLLVLTTLIWGSNFIIGRYLAGALPPLTITAGRFGVAGLVLLPVLVRSLRGRRPQRGLYPSLLALGLTGVFGFNTLLYLGLHYTTSTNSTLTNAVSPLLITLLAGLWLKERITGRQVAGVLVSFLGVAVVQTRGSWAVLRALDFNPGDLIILGNTLLWAFYSVLSRRVTRELSPLLTTAYSIWFGLLFLLPASAWELARAGAKWTPAAVGVLIYLGLFASVLGFVWWNRGVATLGPVLAGNFYNLVPIWAVAMAVLFLGETLQFYHLLGGILVLGGIGLASRRPGEGQQVAVSPGIK